VGGWWWWWWAQVNEYADDMRRRGKSDADIAAASKLFTQVGPGIANPSSYRSASTARVYSTVARLQHASTAQ
jgi:hypothetical protein